MAQQSEMLTDLTQPPKVKMNTMGRTTHRRITSGLVYTLMALLAIIFMFPFFWTVSSSLKEPFELMTFPPTWLPAEPQWGNYATRA